MLTGQLGRFHFAESAASSSSAGRGFSSGHRTGLWSTSNGRQPNAQQWPGRSSLAKPGLLAAATVTDSRGQQVGSKNYGTPSDLQVFQAFPEANGSLPAALYRLLDPSSPVDLPAPGSVHLTAQDNRELDKLVAALGRNKATWRRAINLHEWLLEIGHKADDRLLTTLIRVCAQHGQITTALELYDWMRAAPSEGGAGLKCTVYTYTAAMRAALAGNAIDKALQIWEDAEANNSKDIDCRLCTTLIEVYARKGDTANAIATYNRMRQVPADSKLAPTVHAYTAVMRAAAEGGQWEAALSIWDDMEGAGCKPTGHAYAAAISACASGGLWRRAVALFDSMLAWGIKPDVVSCTALVTALGADGQWERAEKVVEWMLRNDIRPNVRTYTALISALANAKQWDRSIQVLKRMKSHALGAGVEPNAYTYSALLKAMGDHGKWAMAEAVFSELEAEQLAVSSQQQPQQHQQEFNTASCVGEDGVDLMAGSFVDSPTALFGPSIPPQQQQKQQQQKSEKVAAFPGMRQKDTISSPNSHALGSAALHEEDSTVDVNGEAESLEERQAADSVLARTMEQVLGSSIVLETQAALHEGTSPNGSCTIKKSDNENGASSFSYFSSQNPIITTVDAGTTVTVTTEASSSPTAAAGGGAVWTSNNAAVRGLNLNLDVNDVMASTLNTTIPSTSTAAASTSMNSPTGATTTAGPYPTTSTSSSSARYKGPLNEVVCGAMMLAYERAGKWEEAVAVLDRARSLGITPNTVMYNTAMSALGKGGQLAAARALFSEMNNPDSVSYETLIAAHGISGEASRAEQLLKEMKEAGYQPQDYAFCGLIAAYSFHGDWKAALKVKERMQEAGIPLSAHVYNALIAACDRAHQYEKALSLSREMNEIGITPNGMTQQLLESVCREGVKAVENQQAAIAALSAAVAAAGSVMIRAGIF